VRNFFLEHTDRSTLAAELAADEHAHLCYGKFIADLDREIMTNNELLQPGFSASNRLASLARSRKTLMSRVDRLFGDTMPQ
jgi:hypothetical protein